MAKGKEKQTQESGKERAGGRRTFTRFTLELTPEEEEAWAEEFVRRLRADAEDPDVDATAA